MRCFPQFRFEKACRFVRAPPDIVAVSPNLGQCQNVDLVWTGYLDVGDFFRIYHVQRVVDSADSISTTYESYSTSASVKGPCLPFAGLEFSVGRLNSTGFELSRSKPLFICNNHVLAYK